MIRRYGLVAALAALLVVSMVGAVSAAPGTWAASPELGAGRLPTICYDGTDYHIWFDHDVNSTTALRHAKAANPSGLALTEAAEVTGLPSGADAPFVLRVDGVFYMFLPNVGGSTIDLYSSIDGNAWVTVESGVFTSSLVSGGTHTDDTLLKIDQPMVLYDNGTYRMYFQVKYSLSGGGTHYDIGYAESNSLLGFAYKGKALEPVDGEGGQVFQPWVVKEADDSYWMFYTVAGQAQLKVAKSSDGKAWSDRSPIIGKGHYPAVIVRNGIWHMIYGSSGPEGKILYAKASAIGTGTGTISWSVSGAGTPSYPDVGTVAITVEDFSFGDIKQGATKQGTVAIKNTGAVDVNLAYEVSGSGSEMITLGEKPDTLAKNAQDSVQVTVAVPLSASTGSYSATLDVTATATE